MNIFQRFSSFFHKLTAELLFRNSSKKDINLSSDAAPLVSWKVDWIDVEGNKGTFDTGETELEEAEWKFKYLHDDSRRILKMHRGDNKK